MVPVRRAVDYTLQAHAPYPAMALDRLWSVIALNEPAQLLFKPLGIEAGSNLLHFVTSSPVATLVENWPEVAHHTARRLRTESLAQGGVSELDKAADILAAVGGSATLSEFPVVPTVYRFGEMRLSLFSTIAQFGTPTDLALDDLKIELYFPTDEQTRQFLESLSPPKDSSS